MWPKYELIHETRWTRTYAVGEKSQYVQSRFQDGDATITLAELEREWPTWSLLERIDFCQSYCNSARMPERADVLRFVVAHGDHICWPAIALSVARELPLEEAMPALRSWCLTCQIGRGANYYQAVAHTGDPQAHELLKRCLGRTWGSDGLLDDGDSLNWTGYDAVCCLQHLLELGEDPEQYRAQYDALNTHTRQNVREYTQRWLARYFASKA
jgi:hypothetical protein